MFLQNKQADYAAFYEKISAPFRTHIKLLQGINRLFTWLMYVLYPALLCYLFVQRDSRLLGVFIVPAAGFALVTFVRDKINRPRPYEMWHIAPLIHKNTKGHSMPSRHLFSSAVIAMAYLWVFPMMGIVLMAITAIEAAVRVIGGVHYPSDVTIGASAGIALGFLMPLIML